jgi:hypothetical protein
MPEEQKQIVRQGYDMLSSAYRADRRRSHASVGEGGMHVMDQEQVRRIQGLISHLELCHHKAERRVNLIVQAIGEGRTSKGYQAREPEQKHPATRMWRNAIDILSAWVTGDASAVAALDVGRYSGKELVALLGQPTALKEWQVQRAIEKLKASSRMYPGAEYHEIVEHPEQYDDCQEFRNETMQTIIRDTRDGERAEISLAAVIDHLEVCNWNFAENLVILLNGINGNLTPPQPFAAHGRNVRLNSIRGRMLVIANTLAAFRGRVREGEIDQSMLDVLGDRTAEKEALATALEEKIENVFGSDAQRPR